MLEGPRKQAVEFTIICIRKSIIAVNGVIALHMVPRRRHSMVVGELTSVRPAPVLLRKHDMPE